MKNKLIILIIFFQIYNCQSQTSDTTSNSLRNTSQENLDSIEISLENLWKELVFINGGCLTGGQYIKDGYFGNEGCVMKDYKRNGKKWKQFFSYSNNELTNFLVAKFSDTTTTKIHTCPCMLARSGEIAVYALQKIYKKNWYEFESFEQYATKEAPSCADNKQVWLWEILSNEETNKIMAKHWIDLLEP